MTDLYEEMIEARRNGDDVRYWELRREIAVLEGEEW